LTALQLPAAAQRTLDQIADALGVTTALLRPDAQTGAVKASGTASLHEVSALIQAYSQVTDRGARQRCLDFVQAAARQS
ncbi:hypothetical protein, partial [Methylobacterium soli]